MSVFGCGIVFHCDIGCDSMEKTPVEDLPLRVLGTEQETLGTKLGCVGWIELSKGSRDAGKVTPDATRVGSLDSLAT